MAKPIKCRSWPRSSLCVPLIDSLDDFFDNYYYRAVWQHCPPFLARIIYGDERSLAEHELARRYTDHMAIDYYDKAMGQVQFLPWPYGTGEDWYETVSTPFSKLFLF